MDRPLLQRLLATAVVAIGLPAFGWSEEIRALDRERFTTPPDARIVAEAHARGIRLDELVHPADRDHPEPGDAIAGLVSFFEDGRRRQWLVTMRFAATNPAEAAPPLTLHTSAGRAYTFRGAMATLGIATIGPVVVDPWPNRTGPAVREATAAINGEFLALGLADACRTVAKLRAARESGAIREDERFAFAFEPFPATAVEAGRSVAERAGLDEADERAFAAVSPALLAFSDLVARTPGLREVLMEVIRRPSLWSLLVRAGRVETGMHFHAKSVEVIDPLPLGLPGWMEAHQLAFTLFVNGQPALECALLVTAPRPPYLTSAGIVGLTARRPGDDSRRLVIRVVGATIGEG